MQFKMKRNKLMFALLVGIFIFSFAFVNADVLKGSPFTLEEEMQITNYCATSDCTYANITRIVLPNGTIDYLNEEMTQTEYDFNYTYTPQELGRYSFTTCSNPNGILKCEEDSFEVSKTGENLDTSDSIIILVVFVVMIILSGLFITLAFKVNSGVFILIFYGISVIFIFMSSLFGMSLLDNFLTSMSTIVEGYSTYIMVFKILLSMSVLTLVLYAGIRALKMYQMKRGLIEND